MRILLAIDLNDDDLTAAYGSDPRTTAVLAGEGWDDLVSSLDARLTEAYFGPNDTPVRGRVMAAADFSDEALPALLDAAEVGAEGVGEVYDEAVADHVWGSLATFREHLAARTSANDL